ncbi:putative inorganic carbon transporter subunit DabA [Natronoarchaeum sp. GCM10025321]|uniref:putative inorganic carbon transporter subunit DabA n=1 Tax=unclassified Natronoarchaeum TaxID=2620183 RepID=UPI003611708C
MIHYKRIPLLRIGFHLLICSLPLSALAARSIRILYAAISNHVGRGVCAVSFRQVAIENGERRTVDWAETHPKWALAGNVGFVAGHRTT